jgi:hypothetical protein
LLKQCQGTGNRGQEIVEVMGDASSQLPHRLHLLGLQQRRLRLLTRGNLGTEPIIGCSQLLSALPHHRLKLFAVVRQSGGGVAELATDLVEFPHPADQLPNRLTPS